MIWLYAIASVLLVSLISLIGVITLSINQDKLKKILLTLVAFSAGALFGDAFIHLLPEAMKESATINVSLYALSGIVMFFIIEKFIHWRHCHEPNCEKHANPIAYMNLVGDSVHNLIDGMIIAASFLVNIQIGIATTVAVILHEIPQEIGDFGVLLHAGLSRKKALFYNFITALTAVLGAVIVLSIGQTIVNISLFIVPFAAGGFIYIAGSDLIPELHKEVKLSKSSIQLISFILGIAVMLLLIMIE